MDLTPERTNRTVLVEENTAEQQDENQRTSTKPKKPPPITPRRFTRFFTPRPRNAAAVVRTSRTALKALTGPALNSRVNPHVQTIQSETIVSTPRGKKRKLSFDTNNSTYSSTASRVEFLHSSQEIRSSPTIPERRSPLQQTCRDVDLSDEEEVETDIEMDEESQQHKCLPARLVPYRSKTMSRGLLSARLSGQRTRIEATSSSLWQEQTGHFYSSPSDVNGSFATQPAALPFSVVACNTNPIIATGDEEGTIRIIDSSTGNVNGLTQVFFQMRPHDNAIMDLEFSADDEFLATACGDQSCQIIDMRTQTSLYALGGHRCSVKKIAFQPGSGNNVLASCGRDGQLNFWDLRCNNTKNSPSTRRNTTATSMTAGTTHLTPTHGIREAHAAGPRTSKMPSLKSRPNLVPGRADFSVTSLSFLGESRPHLLVTASEIDTTIKVWDIRAHYSASRRAAVPLSCTEEPQSHAFHRRFGITSLVVNTNASRLYALSRDHTVYAYSVAHVVLGSSPHMSPKSKPSKNADTGKEGLGPIYGFRHPSLRVQTFWPRLALRPATDEHPELLAVGSTEDCAVLFPTDERFLTQSSTKIPPRHMTASNIRKTMIQRPTMLTRSVSASSSSSPLYGQSDEGISIYSHGTPLIRGHDKEVTSLTWTSEGSLITASDDYTVRCWREDRTNARRMRDQGEKNGERWKRGWADVGIDGFDEDV